MSDELLGHRLDIAYLCKPKRNAIEYRELGRRHYCRKIVDGFIMRVSLSCNYNDVLIDQGHIINYIINQLYRLDKSL